MLLNTPIRLRLVVLALPGVMMLMSATGCEPNRLLRRQGMDAVEAGDLDRADDRFTKAMRQDPTDWKSLYYLGKIRTEQGQLIEAQLLLDKALSLRGNHLETDDILDAMAEVLYRQEQKDRLHAMLKQAVEDRPTTRSYVRQAIYLHKMGDADGAKLAFQKAVRFSRADDPTPYLAMADFYESIGDRKAAATALRQAYGIDSSIPGLIERLRGYGIVPGPTAGLPPQAEP